MIDITDTHYTAAASGVTTGLMRVFTGGQGTSAAHGTLHAGQPLSSVYASTIANHKKSDEVRLTVANGTVKELELEPPPDTDPDRVPITEEHRKGILDPMTASLLRAPGTGDPVSPEACQRTAVGVRRPTCATICNSPSSAWTTSRPTRAMPARWWSARSISRRSPATSRRARRSDISSKQRDIEVWLAPIAGTRVLVPFRVQGPTPIGRVVLEATQFVSTAIPTGASANGPR